MVIWLETPARCSPPIIGFVMRMQWHRGMAGSWGVILWRMAPRTIRYDPLDYKPSPPSLELTLGGQSGLGTSSLDIAHKAASSKRLRTQVHTKLSYIGTDRELACKQSP